MPAGPENTIEGRPKGPPLLRFGGGTPVKTRRNDIILIAVLLIAGGALALFLFATRQTGGSVSVTMDGELVMELPLSEDARVKST